MCGSMATGVPSVARDPSPTALTLAEPGPPLYGPPMGSSTGKRRGRRIKLPRSRGARIGIGIALVVGGILGFLPVLGFWMVPLGLAVLSVDIPWVRRQRRRLVVWWGRRRDAGRR